MQEVISKIDYNIKYSKTWGHVLFKQDSWVENNTQYLQMYNEYGNIARNSLLKVEKTNFNEKVFGTDVKEGSLVLVNYLHARHFESQKDNYNGIDGYGNFHVTGCAGVFTDNKVSFDGLKMLFDYVLMEKIDQNEGRFLMLSDIKNQTFIGKILKVGTNSFDEEWNKKDLQVKVNDTVLVCTNCVTEIRIDDVTYYCAREQDIVGTFKTNRYSLDNLNTLKERVLVEHYSGNDLQGSDYLIQQTHAVKAYRANLISNPNQYTVVSSTEDKFNVGCTIYANSITEKPTKLEDKEYFIIFTKYIDGKVV